MVSCSIQLPKSALVTVIQYWTTESLSLGSRHLRQCIRLSTVSRKFKSSTLLALKTSKLNIHGHQPLPTSFCLFLRHFARAYLSLSDLPYQELPLHTVVHLFVTNLKVTTITSQYFVSVPNLHSLKLRTRSNPSATFHIESLPKAVKALDIRHPHIKFAPFLKHLRKLRMQTSSRSCFYQLKNLKELSINNSNQYFDTFKLSRLVHLKTLCLEFCSNATLNLACCLTLKSLVVSNCESLEVMHFPLSLSDLNVSYTPKLLSLVNFSQLVDLSNLSLCYSPFVEKLSSSVFPLFSKLQKLTFNQLEVHNLNWIPNLPSLVELSFTGWSEVNCVKNLNRMPKLQLLDMKEARSPVFKGVFTGISHVCLWSFKTEKFFLHHFPNLICYEYGKKLCLLSG
ncbi:hypothetical protein P9112_014259 [Eukaryota sp. TZLM1-RC]